MATKKTRTTKGLLRSMKSKPEVRTAIGTDIYIPNKSGTAVKTELRIVNISGNPWTNYGALTHEAPVTFNDTAEFNDLTTFNKTITVDQDLDASAIVVDSESTTADVIDISDAATTTGRIINILSPLTTTGHIINLSQANKLTAGRMITMYTNSFNSSTRFLQYIFNDHTGSTGCTPLVIRQDAAQRAFFIDQNGNNNSIQIDSEATTEPVIQLNDPKNTSAPVVQIQNCDALTTGAALRVHSNSSNTSSRNIGAFLQANASATNATALFVDQKANKRALHINQDGNAQAIRIEADTTTSDIISYEGGSLTTGRALVITGCNALTTGFIMSLQSNSSDSSTRSLVKMQNNAGLATGATVLHIVQDAAQRALFIDQNGATGAAIQINQACNSASTVWAVDIINNNAGAGVPGGIDFGSFSVDEPILHARDDAITNPGTLTKQIAVEINGTIYYLYAYTTGT